MVDFGYSAGCGAHAVVLVSIEEGKFSWSDLESVQTIHIKYAYKSQSQQAQSSSERDINVSSKVKSRNAGFSPSKSSRIFKNYSQGLM